MILGCSMIVDKKDHVQYLTVLTSYSDDHTCSLTEHGIALSDQYIVHYRLIQI